MEKMLQLAPKPCKRITCNRLWDVKDVKYLIFYEI